MKMMNLNSNLENRTLKKNQRRKSALAVPAWLAVLLTAGTVQADTLWWDGPNSAGTGDGVSDGGSATWDITTQNWDPGSGLDRVAWNNATNDTAVFGGSGGTVTLGTDITLRGLRFEGTGSTTVSGGMLNFEAGGTITNWNSTPRVEQIITSAITGNPSVGVIAFGGPPYDGDHGGLRFAPSSGSVALGTVTLALDSGMGVWDKTILWLSGSTTGNTLGDVKPTLPDRVYSQMICDSGEWTVTGTAQPWTANIRGGTLKVTGSLHPFAGANLSSGTLHYNSPGGVHGGLDFNGGNLDQTSGASITTSTFNPSMQWDADFTFLGSNGANSDLNLGTGPVLLTGTRKVTIDNDATLTVGGVISDNAVGYGLTKDGTGTLELGGINTYGAGTTIIAGTLQADAPDALAAGVLSISSSGVAKLNYSGDRVVSALVIEGSAMPAGTYGSNSSPATPPDDVHFAGTGTVTVMETISLNRWCDGGTTDIDGNGDGLSAGGDGIWNTTIMNWDQGAGLPHVPWDNTTNDTAVFGGSGGTVTLETDITLGGLEFKGTSSTTVSGGTLNFGPGGAITNLNSSDAVQIITSAITGEPAVGVCAEAGPPWHAYIGGLRFAPNSGSMALGTVTLALNAGQPGFWDKTALWLGGTTTGNTVGDVRPAPNGGQYSQMNCDSGEWTVTGTAQPWTANIRGGTLKVTGSLNPFAGTYVSSGTLHYNSPGGVNGGLDFNGGNLDQTSGAPITTSTFNPSMVWDADFTFLASNGANSDLNLGTGSVLLTGTRKVTINNDATLTVGGVISDGSNGYGLAKDGTGTLTLSGANTYGGDTTVLVGTLAVNGNSIADSNKLVIDGGKVDVAAADANEVVNSQGVWLEGVMGRGGRGG